MADLGLRGRRLRQALRVLRVDLEVRVVARVAERRIDVLPYGIHGAALPDAGSCGEVLARTELPRNHSRRGVRGISQPLAPREHRLGVFDAVYHRYVHGSPPSFIRRRVQSTDRLARAADHHSSPSSAPTRPSNT